MAKKDTLDDKSRRVYAVQYNHYYDTNVDMPNVSAEEYSQSVSDWFAEKESFIKGIFNERKGIERISYILHDKDVALDSKSLTPITDDNGDRVHKRAHMHLVVEFKHGNGINQAKAIELFQSSSAENCTPVISNVIMSRRYLVHISEHALATKYKHIYSVDEVHFLTRNEDESYEDIIGIHSASDARTVKTMLQNTFKLKKGDDSKTVTPLERQLAKQAKQGFNLDYALVLPDGVDSFYVNYATHMIASGQATVNQCKFMTKHKMKTDGFLNDATVNVCFDNFWTSNESKFDSAERSYLSIRGSYLQDGLAGLNDKGIPKDALDDLLLSPLDDPDRRNLHLTFISGPGRSGKSQLAKHLARLSCTLPRGVHNAPPYRPGKTYDYINTYKGEDVTIFNEVQAGAFAVREFLDNFDPNNLTPINSRHNDKYWLAHFGYFTTTETIHRFINDTILYNRGGQGYTEKDNHGKKHLVWNKRLWDLILQFEARFDYYIETRKGDNHSADYYIYRYHQYDEHPDSHTYGDSFGFYYVDKVHCDDVGDKSTMIETAKQVKAIQDYWDNDPEEFVKTQYRPMYSFDGYDSSRGDEYAFESIERNASDLPLGAIYRSNYAQVPEALPTKVCPNMFEDKKG